MDSCMAEGILSCVMMFICIGGLSMGTGLILIGGMWAITKMLADIIRWELEDDE